MIIDYAMIFFIKKIYGDELMHQSKSKIEKTLGYTESLQINLHLSSFNDISKNQICNLSDLIFVFLPLNFFAIKFFLPLNFFCHDVKLISQYLKYMQYFINIIVFPCFFQVRYSQIYSTFLDK